MPTQISVSSYYYRRGGAESVMLDQNDMLAGNGWEIVPWAMQYPQNFDTKWSEYFPEEIDFATRYGPVEKLRKVVKSVYSFEAQKKLAALIQASQADIVHAHNVYHHLTPSIFKTVQQAGIPMVMTVHDLKIACPAKLMLSHDGVCERCKGGRFHEVVKHRCLKGSLALSTVAMIETSLHNWLGSYRKHVDRFIIPSQFHRNKLIEWGLPAEKTVYLPNAIDLQGFQPRFEAGQDFVFIGRVSEEKGLLTLVKAVAKAGVKCTIVGTGPQEAELKALTAQTNAQVTFAGYQTGAALHEYIRNARALVLPSECYENAPMGILEAYGLGTPALGSNLGGIPELIHPGQTGLVAEAGNVDSFASALRQLQDMPDSQISDMGQHARGLVERQFSKELYLQRLLDVYTNLGVSIPARATSHTSTAPATEAATTG
jgi:glycosyltransferase involved in cell wall biosynthesis